jgi:hypothetical protein
MLTAIGFAALTVATAALAPPRLAEVRAADVQAQGSFDWNSDGVADRAILLNNGDVVIYVSTSDGRHLPAVYAPEFLTADGGLAGQESTLIVDVQTGAIQLVSRNDSVGRDRFERTVVLTYSDGSFLISQFAYAFRDTLDSANHGRCLYSVMTGKGSRNGKPVRITAARIPLATLADAPQMYSCDW